MIWLSFLARTGSSLRLLLVGLCVAEFASGIAVQLMQGPGLEAVLVDTPLHGAHRVMAHLTIAVAWLAVLATLPLTIERIVRLGKWWWMLHVPLAVAALWFLLLSAFTGYLGGPPVTEASYLRFRVLHTIAIPAIALLFVIGWNWATRAYAKSL